MAAWVDEDPETLFWNLTDPGRRGEDIGVRYVLLNTTLGGNH